MTTTMKIDLFREAARRLLDHTPGDYPGFDFRRAFETLLSVADACAQQNSNGTAYADPRAVLRVLVDAYDVEHIGPMVRDISDELEPTANMQWTKVNPKLIESERYCGGPQGYPGIYVIERYDQAAGAEYEVSRTLPDGGSLRLGEAVSLYEAKFLAAQDAEYPLEDHAAASFQQA
jgi:hypothetical protein